VIGFLTDAFTDHYQLGLLAGAASAAKARGATLIACAGRVPTVEDARGALLGRDSVEALVVTAPTLAYRIGVAGLERYVRALGEDMPACFIGASPDGAASVLTANGAGMEDAVRHLVRVHGRRRIAFVSGPRENGEARDRLAGYERALAAEGLELHSELINYGDFMRPSGERAVAEWAARGTHFDAVVCANDTMAFGVLDALESAGISVPRDVSVAGFDDSEEGRFRHPSLTSVRQPFETLGAAAVRQVIDAVEQRAAAVPSSRRGEIALPPEPRVERIPVDLIVRASCGCESLASGLAQLRAAETEWAFERLLSDRRGVLVAELVRAGRAALGRVSANWAERLIGAFVDELRGVRPGAFTRALTEEVGRARASGGALDLWNAVISVLRTETRPALLGDLRRLLLAEDLLHAGRELIAREMQHEQAMRRMTSVEWLRSLRESGVALTRDFKGWSTALVEHLEMLGFRRAYVAVADQEPGWSRLLLGWDRDLQCSPLPKAPRFRSTRLTPPDLLPTGQPSLWVVLPLEAGSGRFGHLLLDWGPGEGLVWETLAQQLSMVLALSGFAHPAAA
jgi:DNA-binding LacI/PurR family transcriptional regulator